MNSAYSPSTLPWRVSSETNPTRDQWLTWPGVLPSEPQYAPRAILSIRQSGSRGTDTSSQRRATRAISASVASGSGTCSSTSMAVAMSNSLSPKEREVASSARYSRLGRWRFCHSARSLGSSRSMPTMRLSPSRSAHSCVRTPSPQPTSSTDSGAAFSHSSSSVWWKPPISRFTTGLVEPYLSKVLPVGTASGAAWVTA